MFYDYTVDIYSQKDSRNEQKQLVKGTKEFIRSVDADVQSYSKSLAMKEYGLEVECNIRVFMDYSEDIEIGNTFIKYKNKFYKVVGIPWDMEYLELICIEC